MHAFLHSSSEKVMSRDYSQRYLKLSNFSLAFVWSQEYAKEVVFIISEPLRLLASSWMSGLPKYCFCLWLEKKTSKTGARTIEEEWYHHKGPSVFLGISSHLWKCSVQLITEVLFQYVVSRQYVGLEGTQGYWIWMSMGIVQ